MVAQSALWANRAVYQQTGNLVRFTDYAGGQAANGGGTYLFWNGTRWKPLNSNVVLDRIDTQNDGTAGGTPFNLNANAGPILPGQIATFDALEFLVTPFKNGAVETATFQLRIGTAFTTADALIAQFTMSAAEVAGGFSFRMRRTNTSNNTFIREGSGNAQNSFGGPSSLAAPSEVSLTAGTFDASTLRISLWSSMSGATEIPSLRGMRVTLEATDG